ncbi:hypothetical protein BGZ81_003953 [Podila clonocystis]|nr:hypothetical protein BGZ81_003953 [Podila clonocystis]
MSVVSPLSVEELAEFIQDSTNLERLKIRLAHTQGRVFHYVLEDLKKLGRDGPGQGAKKWTARSVGKGMKWLTIAGRSLTMIQAVKGAVQAYSSTIERLDVTADGFTLQSTVTSTSASSTTTTTATPPTSTTTLPSTEPSRPISLAEDDGLQRVMAAAQNPSTLDLYWSVHLPRLTYLMISGYVAMVCLRFESLRWCPSLEILCLCSPSERLQAAVSYPVEQLVRCLIESVHFDPATHILEFSGSIKPTRLRQLKLCGAWFISDKAFEMLGSDPFFPHLTVVYFKGLLLSDQSRLSADTLGQGTGEDVKSAFFAAQYLRSVEKQRREAESKGSKENRGTNQGENHHCDASEADSQKLTYMGMMRGFQGMTRLLSTKVTMVLSVLIREHQVAVEQNEHVRKEYDEMVRWLIGKGGMVTKDAVGKYDRETLKTVLDESIRPWKVERARYRHR